MSLYRSPATPPGQEDESREQIAIDLGARRSSHSERGGSGPSDWISELFGLWCRVDVHTNGLVISRRRRTELLFVDIDDVFLRFETAATDLPRLRLRTFAGKAFEIPSTLTDFATIARRLDTEVTAPLIEPAKEALARGQSLFFGPLILELNGIRLRDRSLAWSGLGRVVGRRDAIVFRAPDTHGLFCEVPLPEIPHPRVLLAVLRMRTKVEIQDLPLVGSLTV